MNPARDAAAVERSVIGFVFICTDQKKGRCADRNFVREAVLTALFHVPRLGRSHGAQHGEVSQENQNIER